jgi:hypothetical protein
MQLDFTRREIESVRTQVHRQRGEIRQLQKGGHLHSLGGSAVGEDAEQDRRALCRARQAQKTSAWANQRQSPGGPSVVTELKWFDPKDDHPPWIKALAEIRQRATREGWCYHHVQAIIVAIDQYAEAALGNRDFFLNKPYSIGGRRNEHTP